MNGVGNGAKTITRSSHVIKTNGISTDYTFKYRYLGFYINEYLDLSRSLDRIISSSNRALSILNHYTRLAGGGGGSNMKRTRLFFCSTCAINDAPDTNCTWDAIMKAELEDWNGKLFVTLSNSEAGGPPEDLPHP